MAEHRYRIVNIDRDIVIRRGTIDLAESVQHGMAMDGDRSLIIDAEAMAPAEVRAAPPPAQVSLGADPRSPYEVAQVCHEANRAFCAAFGDTSQVPWDEAPEWQRESAVQGVLAIVDNPDMTPEQQHKAWADHKRANGWVYGPEKDELDKTHPCLVDRYEDLPPEQRAKDYIFGAITKAIIGRQRDVATGTALEMAAETPRIYAMVQRFLGWPLPKDFAPDCFVSFDRDAARSNNSQPIGTNLFTADQARQMFEHALGVNKASSEFAGAPLKATVLTGEKVNTAQEFVRHGGES